MFEDSDEEEGNRHRTTGPSAAARTPPLTKFSLFEEDSGEEPADEVEQLERDFRLRPHFEGKKGQKVSPYDRMSPLVLTTPGVRSGGKATI